MGVHGLTTYLRENRRHLSTTVEVGSSDRIPVVVDGWSFIYTVAASSGLPWVYGGEYPEFADAVKSVVEAWIHVGLDVHFVFDGPYPDLKFPTLVTRLGQSFVQPSLLFFRTSAVSRATPRSLAETSMLPPLSYATCLHALKELRVTADFGQYLHLHFADEEGDPFAVELAGRINGYVVGNDSDFVILNSDGYRGYVCIDEMVWQAPITEEPAQVDQDDDDFKVVRKGKANRKPAVYSSILPPQQKPTGLVITAYTPSRLAEHLELPVTLLPLLGALVGNDFSADSENHRRRLQTLFFERNFTLVQRIEHAASVVRSILKPSPAVVRRKPKQEVGSVMDLIDRTVNALIARHLTTMGSGEVDQIINGVVEATLQYAIPRTDPNDAPLWPTSVCALHKPDTCSFLPLTSRKLLEQLQHTEDGDDALLQVREKLIHAYREGSLSPKVVDPLNTSTSWPRIFLEHPDTESVSRSIGRPVREWIWSILDDALGLPEPPIPEEDDSGPPEDEHEEESEEDEDEIIDVVESDSEAEDVDPLAPLKGQLHRLHRPDSEEEDEHVTSTPHVRAGPPIVTEYLRRGTRIASEEVTVTPLAERLSSIDLSNFVEDGSTHLLLRPEEDRLTVFLRTLNSDVPSVRSLPRHQLGPVLALRWVTTVLLQRAEESGSKERDRERWTTTEARCWLAASQPSHEGPESPTAPVPITDRNVQITAQMLAALEAVDQLSQVLLLERHIPCSAVALSGRRFHAVLNDPGPAFAADLGGVWDAVIDGLHGAFQEPRQKRVKKAKVVEVVPQKSRTPGGKGRGSFFALLDAQ